MEVISAPSGWPSVGGISGSLGPIVVEGILGRGFSIVIVFFHTLP